MEIRKMTYMRMLTMPFRYKCSEYFSLVRVKNRVEGIRLEVTIMNGDLERIFYGYHIFKVDCDCVKCDAEPADERIRELHLEIKAALDLFVLEHHLRAA